MKKKLPSLMRLKHFRNLCYSLCFLLVCVNVGWGQTQTIGSFPHMDGGFEGQTATTAITGTSSTTTWSVSSTTNSPTRSIVSGSSARSGNKYAEHTTSTAGSVRLQSPTLASSLSMSTDYVVQYYYKTATDPASSGLQGTIYINSKTSKATAVTTTFVSSTWCKATALCKVTATLDATGVGDPFSAFRTSVAAASTHLYDDFVVYPGTAVDNTAPTAASTPTAAIASSTTFTVGWTASTDSDKTGYMVVRYASDPSANAAAVPNVNGIYAVGNTISNGSATGTVAYIGGTGTTSFTDTVADTNVQYYYRIFTVDKAFNYSAPLDLTTVIDNTPPGNPGAVTVSGATATSLSPSWVAASSIDGGGYLVVRYETSPNADNDPTQKTTYVAGNTYTNGTGSLTGTVVYVGTGLITTDTGLTTDVTYYYKVYTFDQAKNYSGESSASGTTTAAVDNTAPNAPGTASISNQTTTTLTTNWLAAAGGVDGGGYMVVRYSGDPSVETGANPVQKATYAVNDTYATGTNPDGITAPKTARVVYIGTDLTCITTGLLPSDYTYYKIYTFDAAKNYSDASFVKGKTSYQFVTPTALAASVPAADGFTANWNLLDNSLTPTATIYTVNTYSVASTESTFVGWTIPATVADTASLTADVTTANNTTKALTIAGGGTINTSVTGNPGFSARGSSWYSTNIISGTEGVDAVFATPKAAPDKYFQVEVNTVGYINPTISSHQYSTATGPRDFKLQYSSTGTSGTFTDLVSTITLGSGSWNTTAVANVALPSSCHNNPNVVLRWVQTSFTNTNGVEMTTPSTGGTSRIDNILVKGFKLTVVNTTTSTSTTNTSIPVTGLQGGSYYYDVVASKNSITDVATGVVSTYVASPNSNLIATSVLKSQAIADYRSTASGNMNSTTIWEYFDAIAWQTATQAPTSANNITISSGHTITLVSNFVVNTGKTLTVNGGIDLAGYVVSGDGSFVLSTTGTPSTISAANYATITLGNNSSLATAITTTSKNFGAAANYVYNGTAVQYLTSLPTPITGNLTISNSSSAGVYLIQHTAINIPGTVTVAEGTKLWFGDGQVTDSAVPGRGTFNLTGTGKFTAGNGSSFVVTGSKGLSFGSGNMAMSGTRTWGSDINFLFYKIDGFTVMQMGDLFATNALNTQNSTSPEITSINNLVVNDPYGVYLGCVNPVKNPLNTGFTTGTTVNGMLTDFAPLTDITIKGNLTFISGKLIANNGTLKLNAQGTAAESFTATDGTTRVTSIPTNIGTATVIVAGTINGAGDGTTTLPNGYTDGKWVVGKLKKATTSGNSPSFTYTIGDATSYSPLTLTFSGNTSAAGSLTASTASGDHAAIATSDLISSKSVNRTWTLTNDALAGFGTYSAAFTYVSGENDANTTSANYGARLFNNGAWSYLTTTNTSDIAATATGITDFGDFAIGEFIGAPAAEPASFCSSVNPTIASLSGSTSATAPKWYAAATGGSALASDVALASGTYYVSQTIGGVESLRTPVAVTLTSSTTTGSESVSACGTSYTWPLNGQSYTASGTYTHVVGCNTATLTLTLTPNTTIGSESVSACGSYTWPLNSQSYTASGTYTHVVGCNTATLTLTLTPATNHTTTVSAFNTYTWANNGETYTTSGTKTGTTTNCVTELLDLTITTTQIPTSPMALCAGKFVADAIGNTSLKFYKDNLAKTTAPLAAATTKLVSGTTYYVTEMINGEESTPRVPLVVNLTALVAPTTIASTEAKVICKYMGTENLVTFTTTPVSGASSYTWNVSSITGAAIVGSATGESITVSFEGVSGTPALIGSVTVDSNNALGCPSGKPKALALTTKAPTAAKSVALSSTAPVFNEGVLVTTSITAVKKAGNFVGTTNTLYLIVSDPSLTADHYDFVLPEGVRNVTGATSVEGSTTLYRATCTSTSTVLTFNLDEVQASNTALAFTCTSVGGCGSASKTLSVARAEAGTPKGLVLTDATDATAPGVVPAVLPIVLKKLDSYTGSLKTRTLTLTATPNVTAGSEASKYKWVLPAGVTTTATPVAGEANTYTSESNVISVNLANVGSEIAFTFKVYGVNGNGASLASKDLACTSALPKAPAAIYAGTNTSLTGTKFLAYNPSCGIVTISVPAVFGVENNFEVTGGTAGLPTIASHEPGSNVATIDLSALGGSVAAKSTITIRAIAYTATGPAYKDYIIKIGTACSTPTRISPEAATATEKFSAVAYPNPSTEGFKVKSSNEKSFGVQVYDMLGRLIEQRQMNSDAQIGSNYAKGIYNVIVNQGANVKTLRVIKQ